MEIWAFIDDDTSFARFGDFERLGLVVGHVGLWVLVALMEKMVKMVKMIERREQWESGIQIVFILHTPP